MAVKGHTHLPQGLNMREIQNCGIQANIPQLLRLLGPAMYKGNTIQVAIKELLQNSFDAVKGQCDPKIEFNSDSGEYYLECKDNGIGMSTETVTKVYLTIGGTLKDNLDVTERSGGLGLAKVQFFLSAVRMIVDTVHNGEHTYLDCTQEELMTGTASVQSEPTDQENGTTVRLYYPRKVTAIDGSKTYIGLPTRTWELPDICSEPLLGYPQIKVTFNGNKICDPLSEVASMKVDFPWGEIEVLYAPDRYKVGGSFYTKVYSAGLYQFKHLFRKSGFSLGYPTWMNIRPKVSAGTAGYPFNNTREDFNVSVEEDLKTLSKYLFDIDSVLRSLKIQEQFSNLKALTYMGVDGTSQEQQITSSKKVSVRAEILHELLSTFATVTSSYEEKEIVKKADTALKESQHESETRKSEQLKLKIAVTGDYSSCTNMFSKIASAFLDDLQAHKEGQRHYPHIAGIILEQRIRGCLTSGNINALFINPLATGTCDQFTWVQSLLFTYSHELAHVNEEYHNERFCMEQSRVWQALAERGSLLKLEGQLKQIWLDHHVELNAAWISYASARPL